MIFGNRSGTGQHKLALKPDRGAVADGRLGLQPTVTGSMFFVSRRDTGTLSFAFMAKTFT